MAKETTWVAFNGYLADGQTQDFAPVSYNRLALFATIQAGVAPTSVLTLQFKIDGVLQDQVFTLAVGIAVPFQVAFADSGLAVPSGSILTAVITANGSAADFKVTIEAASNQTGIADTWYAPTIGDIQEEICTPEYAAFTSSFLTGSTDRIPGLIDDTVNQIRDAIRSGKRNNLGSAGTIPGGAAHLFMHIVKWHFFAFVASIPGAQDKSKEAKDLAETELVRIYDGKRIFVEPTIIGEAVTGAKYGFYDTPLANVL